MPEIQTPKEIEIARKALTESARFVNDQEGVCPVCKEQMAQSTANGIPVHYCGQHNVVQAIQDSRDS